MQGSEPVSFQGLAAVFGVKVLTSPTSTKSKGKSLFADKLAHFWPRLDPLVVKSTVGGNGLEWAKLLAANGKDYERNLFGETAFYSTATTHCPAWVDATHRGALAKQNAEALFDMRVSGRRVQLPWTCEPELFTKARSGHPGFNAEIKTAGDKLVLEEIAVYLLLDMTHSLFPPAAASALCTRDLYYPTPPVGYGLVACAHFGYFVCVEWVGMLHVTPVTDPFFLASDAHRAAVDSLRDLDFGEPVDIGATAAWTFVEKNPAVAWTVRPAFGDKFLKLICYDAFEPDGRAARFRNLRDTYTAYQAARADQADAPPPALLPARLLYGQFAVLVELKFAEGRHATVKELLGQSGPIVEQLAAAIAWLARHGLLHVDVRLPNVLVAGEGDSRVASLVDYDDLHKLEVPVATFAELDRAYRGLYVRCWDVLPALRAAVETEFRRRG